MRRIRTLVLTTIVLFFMAGCNAVTSDILPSLAIIGDSIMEVEQYSDFVDPGVDIIGDFNLDVAVDSNVDTSIIGDYTITYTITYNDVEYVVSRTVRVVELGSVITPGIQLVGESIVEVEQYSDFVDPGVDIIGDFDLDVVVDSNVDTSIIGDYTITYTITYNDVEYVVSRTVRVVELGSEITPGIQLVGDSITEVEQYSDFVDPGVDIIGDFNLDVVVDSNVDTSIIGDYTITYTITYNDVEYEVSRTVRVVEITTTVTPTISLIGDAVMDVEQDTVFVDPGVIVTGDLDLDVVTESNLDMTTEGTYTITYTVTYMDIDYSVSRTVNVVFELIVTPDLFTITLEQEAVTGRSASVLVTVDDADGVISNGLVELYEGDILIDSQAFVNGVNDITFNHLDDSATYTVILAGDYLDSNSKLRHLNGYSLDITTLTVGELSFDIQELTITTNNIEFSIFITDEDDKLTGLAATILDGDTVIETIDLFDELIIGETDNPFVGVNFEGLNELTQYTVQISYLYLPVGESTPVNGDPVNFNYTTLESVVPEIISHEVNERYYSLEGELILDNTDYEGYYIWADIYKGDTFVNTTMLSNGYTTYEFDYLEGNTEYTIEIYADFTKTSTGANYSGVLIDTITATTLEQGVLTPPTVENVVITHTENSITVDFDLVDVDSAMERGILYLYRGGSSYGNFDYVVGHNTITFESSVYENTLYTINIKADFTGNGSYDSIFEEDVYIPPVITVNSFEQTDMFYSGDNVVMKLAIDNDEDYPITAVTINGERYSTFKFPSDTKTLYVDLGAKLTGTYPINLQNIIITFNEVEYTIEAVESTDVTVYVPGSIAPDTADVVVIDIVPQDNFVTVDRDNPSVTTGVIVDVYLENNYNLTITGIKIGGVDYYEEDITVISPTHIQVTAPIGFSSSSSSSSNTLYFSNITFERNMESITSTSGSHVNGYVYMIYDFDNNGTTSNDIIHISTPEGLMAVADETYYSTKVYFLDNDIDMTGYDWTPIGTYDNQFIGAFIGNGYKIYNLNITETYAESTEYMYAGFFGFTNAFIADLTIENMNITISSDVNNYVQIGTLAGRSLGDIVNVHVVNSSITVDGVIKGTIGGLVGSQSGDLIRSSADTDITDVTVTSETTDMRIYVGGLVGDKTYDDIRNSYATGDISISFSTPQTVFAGGLLGTSSYETTMISNSYATGDITTTGDYYSRVGGLIGNSFTATIDNSYASGDVNSSAGTIGGLIGESNGDVKSSFATGTVSNDSGHVGKIFGVGNNYKLDTMFVYDGQLALNNGSPTVGEDYYYSYLGEASAIQFNDIEYYTDFLGWSSHFYDFSSLDIENGDLPV